MTDAAVEGMKQTNQIFEDIIARGDFARLDRIYTRDAQILPPGSEMMEGLEAIRAFWKGAGLKSAQLRPMEVQVLGETASEVAEGTITTAEGTSVPIKYVVLWKQEDGVWKWHRDIWNASV